MNGFGKGVSYLKASFSLLLAVYGFHCARTAEEGGFLDRVNLVSHEAGHLLFGYLGEFIGVVGGTAGQLLVPAAIGVYFLCRRECYSSSVAMFWFGQNMLGISVYAKDAGAMELPLVSVGGGDAMHDWNYILLKMNLLAQDQAVGAVIYGTGVAVMAASVLLGFYLSGRTTPSP